MVDLKRIHQTVMGILFFLAVFSIVLFSLFPFLQIISVSLKDIHDMANPSLIPSVIHLDAYKELLGLKAIDENQNDAVRAILANPKLTEAQRESLLTKYENKNPFPFLRYMLNSFILSIAATLISMTLAVFAAYALARLEFRGMRFMRRGTLFVYLLGGVILMVPLYQMGNTLGLTSTATGALFYMILIYIMQTLPLALYMLGNYFRAIPRSIEEAALIDGYGRIQIILKIIVPLSRPVLITVFVYCFIIAWNEYLYASVFLKPFNDSRTISVAIQALFHSKNSIWDRIMAASTLTLAPVILFFFMLSKNMVSGLSDGGVKG
ncbi:MAG: ABC transporter permease subunit [Spirochaetia bacterium]|nr:ABC transporter permease subunit [Spirochaetia bacterium]